MLHRFTGDQALLLHQGQHTRGGGPGDAEFLFDGVLVYLTAAVTRQEHDDMRVAAGGFPSGLRHALAQIAVDGFGYRAHFDAENMLIHCPPYHAGPCAFVPSPHIVVYATIHDKETYIQQLHIQQSACCSIFKQLLSLNKAGSPQEREASCITPCDCLASALTSRAWRTRQP